jgi:hypothetical protein
MAWHHRFDPGNTWLRGIFVSLFDGLKVEAARHREVSRAHAETFASRRMLATSGRIVEPTRRRPP